MNGSSTGRNASTRSKKSPPRLPEFHYDQTSHGKHRSTLEHNSNCPNHLANPGGRGHSVQHVVTQSTIGGYSTKGKAADSASRGQSTLIASKVNGIPPDVAKKESRGFRGTLPRDCNYISSSKRKKLSMRLGSGKSYSYGGKFQSFSANDVLSTSERVKASDNNILAYQHSRREQTLSLPSLATTKGNHVKGNPRSCRSFPEGRRQTPMQTLQPVKTCFPRQLEGESNLFRQPWFMDRPPMDTSCSITNRYITNMREHYTCNQCCQTNNKFKDRESKVRGLTSIVNELTGDKNRRNTAKRPTNKTLLPGFFAPKAKTVNQTQEASKDKSSRRLKFPALTQNLFQTCVQKASRRVASHQRHQQTDSQPCGKQAEENYYLDSFSPSSPSSPSPEEVDASVKVPLRSCGSNQTKSRRKHKKMSRTNVIQQHLANMHKHLPPILDPLTVPKEEPMEPRASPSVSTQNEAELDESTTDAKMREPEVVSLPPLPSRRSMINGRRDSLHQDADDEESATYQLSTDGDIPKSSNQRHARSLSLDAEFSYKKFASSKRKRRCRNKEKNLPPVGVAESSSQMLDKLTQRKKPRKKKKTKATSDKEESTLKQKIFKGKHVTSSVGSEGDDEMDDDDDTNAIL